MRLMTVLTDPVCRCCGRQPDGRVDGPFTCGFCRQTPPAFDRARAAIRFDGVARALIHAYKYQGASWLTPDLTDLLEGALFGFGPDRPFHAITAVPLHDARRRARGYNQSELLARSLARRLKLPCMNTLVRIRPTPSQTLLNAAARRRNLRDAFAPVSPEWIVQRNWLLVDDVMTTGATLDEAARVLRASGALDIWAVTVARG